MNKRQYYAIQTCERTAKRITFGGIAALTHPRFHFSAGRDGGVYIRLTSTVPCRDTGELIEVCTPARISLECVERGGQDEVLAFLRNTMERWWFHELCESWRVDGVLVDDEHSGEG